MAHSQNGMRFLERILARPTYRQNVPIYSPQERKISTETKLFPPHPRVDLVADAEGSPPPDRGGTIREWPPQYPEDSDE